MAIGGWGPAAGGVVGVDAPGVVEAGTGASEEDGSWRVIELA
jgi:hypothetical protein